MKLASADETAEIMLDKLLNTMDVQAGDKLLVIVNGSGGTTLMEQYISFRDAKLFLEGKGINVSRGHAAEVLTVQEAGGYQLMALKLDDELTALWDAPCDSPAYTVQ